MRLLIAAVGRARPGPWRALYEDYARRVAWPIALREIDLRQPLAIAERRAREGALLAAAVPPGSIRVVLDALGKPLTSAAFAKRLARWRDDGAGHVAFLIGGADGHDRERLAAADFVLSLGAMTWPHMLARVMLVEQIYRAQQILAGHPYHRDEAKVTNR
ncbi:MAG: 23S rRNA (pseudouridine(1915)-N(3))-methyltransferase RlmH [Alphaproteobacteria bacterium]|nr:23S rRNA (pseudouridine(1915)-N(3))-methyltransferase RlmH [Alphaproteobacteria bacterium]